MKRAFALKLLCCAGIGAVLGFMGVPFNSWQYWVIVVLAGILASTN